MNKTYRLNTLLAVIVALTLLLCVAARAFCHTLILPKLDIPFIVILTLIALVIDHYLSADAKRCYICIPVLSALTFGLLPLCAFMVTLREALVLAVVGGVTVTVTTLLFTQIQERLSSGSAAKASALFSAVSLYMAAQCLAGIIL
ncbi:MAG: hypothetical protein IKM11_04235 [Oscillospiraceae bacterium]|nr:hypothetical protein [Oscillospiraceae bacterium]